MNDDTVRLLIDMGVSKENVQAVVKELERLRTGADSVARGYELMAGAGEGYVVSARHVETAEDRLVREAVELTRAQRAVNRVLAESATATHAVATAATGAMGTAGAGGRGLLGASYAFQDFTSVITQGGANALPRAMGAISNNMDQMAIAAGLTVAQAASLSIGFVALTAAMPALIGLFQSLTGSVGPSKEDVEQAKGRFEEIQAEIKKTHEAYEKMIGAPTDHEKEAASTLKLLLEDRPTGARAAEAVAVGISEDEARAGLTPDEAGSFKTGPEVERAAFDAANQGKVFNQLRYDTVLKQLTEANNVARGIAMTAARRRRGESVVAGAQVAGPKGAADLAELLRLTKGVPGLEALQGATPEQMKADEEDFAAREEENADTAAAGKAIGDRRKADARKARALGLRTKREAAALKRMTDEGVSGLEQEAAARERDDKEAARAAKEAAKKAPDLARQKEAARLLAHGPEIVGQAFGPDAAAAAAGANAAEVQAMREKTVANLKDGQAPYAALLDAFREVYEASARNADANRQFGARLSGMNGQFRGLSARQASQTQTMLDTN